MLPSISDVSDLQFEQVIESRPAAPKSAKPTGNDTDVITHVLAAAVKRWKENSYHLVMEIRRVDAAACRNRDDH
jgi:hypothetical protein